MKKSNDVRLYSLRILQVLTCGYTDRLIYNIHHGMVGSMTNSLGGGHIKCYRGIINCHRMFSRLSSGSLYRICRLPMSSLCALDVT